MGLNQIATGLPGLTGPKEGYGKPFFFGLFYPKFLKRFEIVAKEPEIFVKFYPNQNFGGGL